MEPTQHYRPRVSRETRLLLTTAFLAIVALWVLARVRFPDRPAPQTAVPPILTSLGVVADPDYEGLSARVDQVRDRISSLLVAIDVGSRSTEGHVFRERPGRTGLRIGDDLAVMLLPAGERLDLHGGTRPVAHDGASGLAVVRVQGQSPAPVPAPRFPRQPQRSRYLMATDASSGGVSLRPIFVGGFTATEAPVWSAVIWSVPAVADLQPGAFLFTTEGELAGLAVEHRGAVAVVTGDVVLDEANRLVEQASRVAGEIGVQVQALTPSLGRVTGASAGVVVTWADSAGAAHGVLEVGDVIEGADGQPLPTPEHWARRAAQFEAGTPVTLSVRRGGEVRDVHVVPATRQAPAEGAASPSNRSLGLVARVRPGAGSEVTAIEPFSIAARAGLAVGDVITSLGGVTAPTPAQVARVAREAPKGEPVLVGVRRGVVHLVLALER